MTSIGAVVRWGAGCEGIIRSHELDWGRTLDQPKPKVSVGDEFLAVVLTVERDGQRVELSRKRALSDPWRKIREGRYREGQIVRGEVVNAVHFGAFVEIEPGIEGLIRKSAIPGGEDGHVEDLLWLGDQVEVVIGPIDPQKEELTLSLIERLRRRAVERAHQAPMPQLDETLESFDNIGTVRPNTNAGFSEVARQRIQRITIVDDETAFAEEFGDWLRRWGYDVRVITDGRRALEEASVSGLFFMDIDLGDISGFWVAEEILKQSPKTHIVFMSGVDWFMNNDAVPVTLAASGLLAKPFQDNEVLDLLGRIERGEQQEPKQGFTPQGPHDGTFVERIAAQLRARPRLDQAITSGLDEVRQQMRATTAILFKIDRFTLNTTAYVSSDNVVSSALNEIRGALRYSVVMDVAAQRKDVIAGAAQLDKKYDSLQRFLNFQSCIGVPLPDVSHDAWYALFVLDSRPDRYDEDHFILTKSMAWLLASRIQVDATQTLAQNAQQHILAGQISSSLMHELRNKMSVIRRASSNLLLDCNDFNDETRPISPRLWGVRVRARAERIVTASDQLQDLVSSHLGLTRIENTETVDVNRLLAKTIQQIAPSAKEQHVDIFQQFEPRLPQVMAIPVQLEQVFLNVALNAVQQMGIQRERYDAISAHTRGALRGRLKIATAFDPKNNERSLKIRFSDEGPGIHRNHWDWIFQLGTSTRQGGTGIGLYVCRDLLAAMGGQIKIEQSLLFLGSTFLIELPVVSAKESCYA